MGTGVTEQDAGHSKPASAKLAHLGNTHRYTLDVLINRLQRERGATCAWLSSRCSSSSVVPGSCGAGSLVADIRQRTNHCILMAQFELDTESRQSLTKVRDQCDRAVGAMRFKDNKQIGGPTPAELARTVCSIFETYSDLIAMLLEHVQLAEDNITLRNIELLKEQYGLMRGYVAAISFLSDECLASMPLRALKILPDAVERQREINTAIRRAVAWKPRYVRDMLNEVLLPPALLAPLITFIEDDDFDLHTLRQRIHSFGCDSSSSTPNFSPVAHPGAVRQLHSGRSDESLRSQHMPPTSSPSPGRPEDVRAAAHPSPSLKRVDTWSPTPSQLSSSPANTARPLMSLIRAAWSMTSSLASATSAVTNSIASSDGTNLGFSRRASSTSRPRLRARKSSSALVSRRDAVQKCWASFTDQIERLSEAKRTLSQDPAMRQAITFRRWGSTILQALVLAAAVYVLVSLCIPEDVSRQSFGNVLNPLEANASSVNVEDSIEVTLTASDSSRAESGEVATGAQMPIATAGGNVASIVSRVDSTDHIAHYPAVLVALAIVIATGMASLAAQLRTPRRAPLRGVQPRRAVGSRERAPSRSLAKDARSDRSNRDHQLRSASPYQEDSASTFSSGDSSLSMIFANHWPHQSSGSSLSLRKSRSASITSASEARKVISTAVRAVGGAVASVNVHRSTSSEGLRGSPTSSIGSQHTANSPRAVRASRVSSRAGSHVQSWVPSRNASHAPSNTASHAGSGPSSPMPDSRGQVDSCTSSDDDGCESVASISLAAVSMDKHSRLRGDSLNVLGPGKPPDAVSSAANFIASSARGSACAFSGMPSLLPSFGSCSIRATPTASPPPSVSDPLDLAAPAEPFHRTNAAPSMGYDPCSGDDSSGASSGVAGVTGCASGGPSGVTASARGGGLSSSRLRNDSDGVGAAATITKASDHREEVAADTEAVGAISYGVEEDNEPEGELEGSSLFGEIDASDPDEFDEVQMLGHGTFGHAVLLRSWRTGVNVVAKKLLVSGITDFAKLENEVAICASLRHRNIVQYLGTSHDDTFLTLLLEYAGGGSLADKFTQHAATSRPFAERTAVRWIRQLASAIDYVHSMDVIHRDLSASNVFLSIQGDVKIGDFGLSRTLACGLTQAGGQLATTMCGTPSYCSPELVNGRPYGAASDVWAVGLLAYQIFTLRHPFDGCSMNQLVRKIIGAAIDLSPLEKAPYPAELTAIADTRHLLHPEPAFRMKLSQVLAMPVVRGIDVGVAASPNRVVEPQSLKTGRLSPVSDEEKACISG